MQLNCSTQMVCALADWRARKVTSFIESNLENPIRVQDLATLVGLSAGQFSRSFHSRFGVTARSYLARRRIDFAKSQMLATDQPLVEIALLCGMSDQAHFAKTFRRVVGTSPSQWRDANRR